MSAFTLNHFDVLGYIEKAEKLGISREVAKFQAREMEFLYTKTVEEVKKEIKDEIINKELSTKGDVREVELVLKKEIREVELKLEKEIEIVRKEIADLRYSTLKFTIWTGVGVVVATVGCIFTLLKVMLHY